MIRERPLIFSSAMVRALIAGRKTQTRRLVEPQPTSPCRGVLVWKGGEHFPVSTFAQWMIDRCPYGQVGDRLWVREAYALSGFHQDDIGDDADLVERPLVYCRYAADGAGRQVRLTKEEGRKLSKRSTDRHRETSGRFMYRSCSRITLEVTRLRVERVQDIGRDGRQARDVLAEGVTPEQIEHWVKFFHPDDSPAMAFAALWDTVHGKGAWSANPYVWCIEFRLLAVATEGVTQ